MTNTGGTPAGWNHAPGDPDGTQRYWDGSQWVGEPQQMAQQPQQSSPPSFNQSTPDLAEASGFFKALFDTSFKRLITPSVVKVYFIVGLVGIALGSLLFLVAFALQGGGAFVIGLIVVPLVAFFYLLGLRLFCEFLVVLFKIETNTRKVG